MKSSWRVTAPSGSQQEEGLNEWNPTGTRQQLIRSAHNSFSQRPGSPRIMTETFGFRADPVSREPIVGMGQHGNILPSAILQVPSTSTRSAKTGMEIYGFLELKMRPARHTLNREHTPTPTERLSPGP